MNIKVGKKINSPYYENLIKERGLNPITFLNPTKDDLIDIKKLDNIDKAINILNKNCNKKAATIVDSDCDGFCASAILINYLKELYPEWKIDFFVHERKGHGLEDIVINNDISNYDLIFLPDAGSNDDEYFNEYNYIDFIVLDHHQRTSIEDVPSNVVLINNQTSSNYENKSLSGAGVTWKFVKYLDYIYNKDYADKYLDLAAVAIIGDVMDITSQENRYIISTGLSNFNNKFLQYLYDNSAYRIGETITPIGVAFYMVPLINSMCRMGSIEEKERMFLSFIEPETKVVSHKRGVTPGTMVEVVTESVRECTNAKSRQSRLQDNMTALCNKQIIEKDLLKNKILVIILDEFFDNIPSEMNGLAATKISSETGHPTLIGRVNEEGYLRGSIRGLTTIDMPPFKEFLQESGMFEYVEGHNNAAGFSIPYKKVDSFIDWANRQLKDISLDTKTWNVDFSLEASNNELSEIIEDMDKLKKLWGQGFPEALIHVKNIEVSRANISVIGKNNDTVKIENNGIVYMFFKRTPEQVKELIKFPYSKFDIVGKANLNIYYNKKTPQIFVDDYTITENYTF